MTRVLLPVCVLAFLAGLALSASTYTDGPLLQGDFVIAQETPYNGASDGVQFFALQRVDAKTVDQATCSIDADLPLAGALRLAKGQRVRITIEAVKARTIQELRR